MVFVGVFGALALTDNFFVAFGTGTMNPITRIPLFIMGICAGRLSLRHPVGSQDPLPWPSSYLSLFPALTSSQGPLDWLSETRFSSLNLLFLTLFYSVVDTFVYPILGAIVLQAFVPFAQLTIIVGLTRDCSESNSVYQFLVSPTAQWLGKHSMTIYLLHFNYILSLAWAVYGGCLKWCDALNPDNNCDDFNDTRLMPVWGIPVVVAATFVTAPIVYSFIEEPLRKYMQVKKV